MSCSAVGTPSSHQTSYSNSFGGDTSDLANTSGTMAGHSQLTGDLATSMGVEQILNQDYFVCHQRHCPIGPTTNQNARLCC